MVAAVASVALLGLVACGDDDVCSRPDGAGCYPDPDLSGDDEPNEADEDFVLEQALSIGEVGNLAELALETSDESLLLDLADEYSQEADDLLEAFDEFEEEWDLDPIVYDSAVGSVATVVLPRYAGDDDYFVLEDLSGAEFDEFWTEVMLERVAAQLAATEDLLDDGDHPDLREVAERWIGANEAMQVGLEELQQDLAP